MEFKIQIAGREKYIRAMIDVINLTSSLNLSKFEIDILLLLFNNKMDSVTTTTRDLIRKTFNKDKFTTNNYIKKLKDKKLLIDNGDNRTLQVNPNIIKVIDSKNVNFEFELINDN